MAKYYLCSVCGNLLETIEDSSNIPTCCDIKMNELQAGSTDGKVESHTPVIEVVVKCKHRLKCVRISVGKHLHPSEKSHYIIWVQLFTDKGSYLHYFKPGDDPVTMFYIDKEEKITGAYSYCNIHGLWYEYSVKD